MGVLRDRVGLLAFDLKSLYFVELLPALIFLANHDVLVQGVDQIDAHLLVQLLGELIVDFVSVEVAVEGRFESEAIANLELTVEHDSRRSLFRLLILKRAAVVPEHFSLVG